MRVLIIGGSGMLGHKLCRVLSKRMDMWATVREAPESYAQYDLLPMDHLVGHIDVQDMQALKKAIEVTQPDAIINAAGIVKQREEAKHAIPSIQVNALFPHQLAALCSSNGIRVVQVSTDCVFSGLRGDYSEVENPDPVDLYGRSKLLGEITLQGCLTLRTSILGWQMNRFSSLLSWFASQRGRRIKGYRKAIYSGFSTSVLASLIGDLIETRPDIQGIYHVASEPISKYDLLLQLSDALGWDDIEIDPDEQFYCDRSLNGLRFTTATGWKSPAWDGMIAGLATEWPSYATFYKSN